MESANKDVFNALHEEFQNIRCPKSKKPAEEIPNETKEALPEYEFEIIEARLEELLSKVSKDSPDYCRTLSMVTSILYEKAKICLNANLYSQSRAYLEKSLRLMDSYTDNPQIVFLHLRVVNYLAYVVSRLGYFETARDALEKVVHNVIKSEPLVYSTEDLFVPKKSDEGISRTKLHKLEVNNMQMLGWIYGKLGMPDEYADMIHKSLQKELDVDDEDSIHWSIRCCRLASLYLIQDRYEEARYHLAAAKVVLDSQEVKTSSNSHLFKAKADLARTWVNYGLQLFGYSKRRVLEKVLEESEEVVRKKRETNPDECMFNGMEIELPDVPTDEINGIFEARDLFKYTHKWLKRARLFYTLRDFPLQYINVILELSELYKYLGFYEPHIDSQYAIHRKRFETLETLGTVLREVRPSCYAMVSIEIIREIMDVQLDMMNLNLKKLYNPREEMCLTENSLKKRMYIVNDINNKIARLYKKEHESSSQKISLGDDLAERIFPNYQKPKERIGDGEGEGEK